MSRLQKGALWLVILVIAGQCDIGGLMSTESGDGGGSVSISSDASSSGSDDASSSGSSSSGSGSGSGSISASSSGSGSSSISANSSGSGSGSISASSSGSSSGSDTASSSGSGSSSISASSSGSGSGSISASSSGSGSGSISASSSGSSSGSDSASNSSGGINGSTSDIGHGGSIDDRVVTSFYTLLPGGLLTQHTIFIALTTRSTRGCAIACNINKRCSAFAFSSRPEPASITIIGSSINNINNISLGTTNCLLASNDVSQNINTISPWMVYKRRETPSTTTSGTAR